MASNKNRRSKLFKMTGQLALKSLSGVLSARPQAKTRIEQAKILTESLSELKGAAMKAGQLLSLDSSDLLPPEAIEILSTLQNKAKAHPYEEIEATLKNELQDRFTDIENISQTPIAAASIGQVHAAQVNGKKVALKIQYEGVAESIDSDIKTLRRVTESFLKLSGKPIPLEESFEELKRVLKKEVDYLNEMNNLLKYHELTKEHKDYIVPSAYKDYCTLKVLCMDYIEGISFQEWLNSNPTKEERENMANVFLKLFCLEFIEWGFVQTDPNFANYMIEPANQKLICLDFGATLEYSEEFRLQYAELLKGMRKASTTELFKLAQNFNLLSEKESRETQIAFKEMIQVALEPFKESLQPFDFQDKDFAKRTIAANMRFSRLLKHSPPPHQILFLHRKLGGIFNLVKRMDVRIDLLPYWREMTKLAN